MDRARNAISSLFGAEARSYTRFSLTRRTDGDGSRVEMKLAENENDEEMGDAMADGMETRIEKPQNNYKPLCYLMFAVLLVLIGFLVGYLAFRGQTPRKILPSYATGEKDQADDDNDEDEIPTEIETEFQPLYYSNLKKMLQDNLGSSNMLSKIREVSEISNRVTGSNGDLTITQTIRQELLKTLGPHNVWFDTHYVSLQVNGKSPNRISIVGNSSNEEVNLGNRNSKIYCPYSAVNNFMGKLVYANYGTEDDFKLLTNSKVLVNGSVVIVRAGKINFAEKVFNAEKLKAGGVLIYPDPKDYDLNENLAMFGHVHFGLGDPRTPGFPSFNHTQFPPTKSSGLPGILAHPISSAAADYLLGKIGAAGASLWDGAASKVADDKQVRMEINNVEAVREMHNVFGVIKGFEEPDHYVVIGAHRDSYGPGVAKSGVGTALLLELVRVFSKMVEDGFRPRRSIIFASWSGGDFGAIGATEWLEGYMSVLHLKVCAYFGLDGAVLGAENFKMYGSSMLYNLIGESISEVKSPSSPDQTIYEKAEATVGNWLEAILQPIPMDTSVYAFLAIGGIPAVGLSFTEARLLFLKLIIIFRIILAKPKEEVPLVSIFKDKNYPLNTEDDVLSILNRFAGNKLESVCRAMAEVIGIAVIKIINHHQLPLDFQKYAEELLTYTTQIQNYTSELQARGLTTQWLFSARGDLVRAANRLQSEIETSDMSNVLLCRTYNNRIMRVEYNFLSPYVSVVSCPYRHLLYGKGHHTLAGIVDQLKLLRMNPDLVDFNMTRNDLAFATWTIQGAANALNGDVWTSSNSF